MLYEILHSPKRRIGTMSVNVSTVSVKFTRGRLFMLYAREKSGCIFYLYEKITTMTKVTSLIARQDTHDGITFVKVCLARRPAVQSGELVKEVVFDAKRMAEIPKLGPSCL